MSTLNKMLIFFYTKLQIDTIDCENLKVDVYFNIFFSLESMSGMNLSAIGL